MSSLDRTSLVAGIVLVAIGVVTLLDRTGVLDLHWSALWPMLTGALGAILLTSGLEQRDKGVSPPPADAP